MPGARVRPVRELLSTTRHRRLMVANNVGGNQCAHELATYFRKHDRLYYRTRTGITLALSELSVSGRVGVVRHPHKHKTASETVKAAITAHE